MKRTLAVLFAAALAFALVSPVPGACAETDTATTPDPSIAALLQDAEGGSAEAQFKLGTCYDGILSAGVPKDHEEAVRWYRKAAEQGHAKAQYSLGDRYYWGVGVPKDYAEAARWYRKAAEQGVAGAQYNLGCGYYNGEGVTKDHAEAVRWYRKAAEQGVAEAQYCLGNGYYNGEGVQKDHAEAVRWWSKAAEQGQVNAQHNLGYLYVWGDRSLRSDTLAVHWYLKAAEQGHAKSQYFLGCHYHSGLGVKKDYVRAHMWLNLAAAAGIPDAREEREKVAKRMSKEQIAEAQGLARAWKPNIASAARTTAKDPSFTSMLKDAEGGSAEAQFKLANCYAGNLSMGVPQDDAEAARWYRKSAEQGHAEAQRVLGGLYADGKGVPKDRAESERWFERAVEQSSADAARLYRKAAEQGDADAQASLGICYYIGAGVPQDRAEAARWFRKATEQVRVRAENAEAPPGQVVSTKPSRPANAAFVLTPEIIQAAVARGESLAKKGNIYEEYRRYQRSPVREEYDKGKKRLQKVEGDFVTCRSLGALPVVEASYRSSLSHRSRTIPAGLLDKNLTLTTLEFDVLLTASPYLSETGRTYEPTPGSLGVDKFILLDDKGNSFEPIPGSTVGESHSGHETLTNSYTDPGQGPYYYVTRHYKASLRYETMSYKVVFSMFDADGQPIIAPDVKKITLRLDDAFVEYDLKPLVFK